MANASPTIDNTTEDEKTRTRRTPATMVETLKRTDLAPEDKLAMIVEERKIIRNMVGNIDERVAAYRKSLEENQDKYTALLKAQDAEIKRLASL